VQRRVVLLVMALASIAVVACGSDRAPKVLMVPSKFATIQLAVDEARRGDIVMVSAGTYNEEVEVEEHAGITIRGVDRNTVILDGQHTRDNGILVAVDDVSIENLTVTGYKLNGVLFSGSYSSDADGQPKGVSRYRASYVTVYNNGLYGIYAFYARGGIIEHVYASGHPDAGIYIGQCKPCDAIVDDVISENNAIGYQGTNASNVDIVRSTWNSNRAGVVIQSQQIERLSPGQLTRLVGNVITDNSNLETPSTPEGGFGIGVAIMGSLENTVERNRITGHAEAGIALFDDDSTGTASARNRVAANVLTANALDVVLWSTHARDATGNCFVGNTLTSSTPSDIESSIGCGTGALTDGRVAFTVNTDGIDYRTMAVPPPQPTMPQADTAPATVIPDKPAIANFDAIALP
jgi:hypothetical protein